jgi:FlaA1/EpsC-like NDP-sugar epimerase
MGATKRFAELILQALATEQNTTLFTMVRFGNVLDSSGSVVPLFKDQIKKGGPVTVTDINVIRYFMTVSEAVELVIQASAMSKGGDVFVLDMGEPISIKDLAIKMINLSGFKVKDEQNPNGDIEIIYTGLKHGEKMYEEPLTNENVSYTNNNRIMRAKEYKMPWDKLKPIIDELDIAINNNNHEKLRNLLIKVVPDFKPQYQIEDLSYNHNNKNNITDNN